MKTFHCDACGQQVFFENVRCEACGHLLGYVPGLVEVVAFEPDPQGFWRSLHDGGAGSYKQCHNYAVENVCNWMLPAEDPGSLCSSCRLTQVIPGLEQEESRQRWFQVERAKRRLYYTLALLGLPLASRQDDPLQGLAFEFREQREGGPAVHTGHSDGVITLNLAEADDAYREKVRTELGEPYRTLLGHFRHESGHYYFMRLMREGPLLDACRELFGDDREDYGEALQRHYQSGPPAQWEQAYVSAYATMHPYEDWAESWAHYLHMVDTLETAQSCGLSLAPAHPDQPSLSADGDEVANAGFNDLIGRWFPLTYVLNSLNRSLGLQDGYPFTLATPVIDKLRFIHRVIHRPPPPPLSG